jgi:hypothetical protein
MLNASVSVDILFWNDFPAGAVKISNGALIAGIRNFSSREKACTLEKGVVKLPFCRQCYRQCTEDGKTTRPVSARDHLIFHAASGRCPMRDR